MNKAKITLDGKTTIEVELTPAQEALIRQGLIGGYSIAGMSLEYLPEVKEVNGL